MTVSEYQRVDVQAVVPKSSAKGVNDKPDSNYRIRWTVIPLSVVLCIFQALLTCIAVNVHTQDITPTLITVIGFGVMVMIILICNPLIRILSRGLLRPLGRAELTSMIAALMVTSGVATFGLADQLVPLIPTPWNSQWNVPQAGWDKTIHPNIRHELYITDAETIRVFREGIGQSPQQDAHWREWRTFYVDVWLAIPWQKWIHPLLYWLIFIGGCYGIFFCLSFIVLDYWANREKLIFPLAKLHEAILPENDQSRLPLIFKSPLFWCGFALSALMLSYNAAAVADWIPLNKINLGMDGFKYVVRGTFLEGTGSTKFLIIFTAIGIAFLLPLEISFSVWFYYLAGQGLIWLMYRKGYRNFSTEWIWEQNPVTSQASGAILLFCAISLYRCIREYFRLSRGKSGVRRLKILTPVIGLFVSMTIVTLWINWNRVPFHWALLVTLFVTLITLGLMRIVAESGIFFFQSHASFFHIYKMLGLGKWMSPLLIAPLLPIYSVLFLDVKTFLAPSLLNAAKIQHDVGGNRFRFYLNVIVSLVVTVIFSLGCSIFLAYTRGANQMHSWFYSKGPRQFFENAASATTRMPKFEPTTFAWFCLGAAWVAFSMFIRQRLFWFPHPAGYIMLINPLIQSLWFSFFIGWVCKKFVVRYGGKMTFDKTRLIMLGLIIGELLVIFLTATYSMINPDVSFPGIDLNRYKP